MASCSAFLSSGPINFEFCWMAHTITLIPCVGNSFTTWRKTACGGFLCRKLQHTRAIGTMRQESTRKEVRRGLVFNIWGKYKLFRRLLPAESSYISAACPSKRHFIESAIESCEN